jgi:hypothetical protein
MANLQAGDMGKRRLRQLLHRQLGQSMIEYTVVVTFGVLTLTTGPMRDVIVDDLIPAVRNNYEGYSYAVSLSDYPDGSDCTVIEPLLVAQGLTASQAEALCGGDPAAMFDEIKSYVSGSIPDLSSGIDDIGDMVGLSPSSFLEGISPF